MSNTDRFRGQQINSNEWVYGYYYTDQIFKDGESCVDISIIRDEIHQDHEVKSETVTQSTGLKDKNGKLIYEGDIVELKCGDDDTIIGAVEWLNDKAEFSIKHPKGYHGHYGFWQKIINVCDTFKIIGNKFEHSHLLEGKCQKV